MATPRITASKSLRPRKQPVSLTAYKQTIELRLNDLISNNSYDDHTRILREIRDLTKDVLRRRD